MKKTAQWKNHSWCSVLFMQNTIMIKPEGTERPAMNNNHKYNQMEQEHRAFEELLSNLPEDMVEIAYRAVLL